ncbi:TonB-dependent siderophore receptor [Agaricicola taiwanensis]|uniref:TonB-dependent siderophore receptor n=1 Tax=Agaricicola taiwanensis TaxID=591372 RepID=UPI001E4879EB|nr:TonB-dependent siderophore receptor [Agaricicola taiwanensis]
MKSVRGGLLAGTSLVLFLSPALAQSQPEVELPAIVVSGERANGPVEGTVAKRSASGTKTDSAIIETPQSISVVPKAQIEMQKAQNASEALRYTPGITAEIYGNDPRADWIKIRGFQSPDYLDGLPLPRGTYAWGRTHPFFLERIEVLKGPASVLYGQTPPGGIYNQVSKLPTDEHQGEVQLSGGHPTNGQAKLDISGPIDADKRFLYRFIAAGRLGETSVDHVDNDQIAVAPSFTIRPSDATELTLLGNYQNLDSGSLQFLPSQGTFSYNPNGRIPRDTFLGDPDYDDFNLEQSSVGYQFRHDVTNDLTFRQNLRFSTVDYDLKTIRGFGFGGGQLQNITTRRVEIRDRVDAFSVDNQLEYSFDTGPVAHRVLAGLDYRHLDIDYFFGTSGGSTGLYNPFTRTIVSLPGPISTITNDVDQSQTQVGVYLQDQIKFDRFTLMLSGRHDWVDGEFTNRAPAANPLARNLSTDDRAFSGRAGLIYNFDNGLAPFVSYATSFQANVGALADGSAPDPTTGEQWEAGIKYQPQSWGNSMLQVSGFSITQQDVIAGAAPTQTQVGEVKVKGLEFEARMELTRGLTLLGAWTVLDSEITDDINPAVIGNELPITPDNTASLWLDYAFQNAALQGLSIGGGIRHVDGSWANTANTFETDSYTLVDLAARYDLGKASPKLKGAELALNVSNLFDKEYVSSCNDLNTCYWGNSRTVLGTLTYRW